MTDIEKIDKEITKNHVFSCQLNDMLLGLIDIVSNVTKTPKMDIEKALSDRLDRIYSPLRGICKEEDYNCENN